MYTPYHNHSKYSVADGVATCKGYAKKCQEYGIKALGISEHGNCYSWIEHAKACLEYGIKPLFGIEAYVLDQFINNNTKSGHHIILIVQNEKGYSNLLKMVNISCSHVRGNGMFRRPNIPKETILEYNEGIIMTTSCRLGVITPLLLGGNDPYIRLADYEDVFKDRLFYEIQPAYEDEQRLTNNWIFEHCDKERITVATDSHYVNFEDWDIQRVLKKTLLPFGNAFENWYYLWSYEQLKNYPGIPEYSIENTNKIADMVDFTLPIGHHIFPKVDIPDEFRDYTYLSSIAKKGLLERISNPSKAYFTRLDYELKVIKENNTSPYFIMNYNIFNEIRKSGIIYGPRGSACGSLVAYCIYLHDIDPIKHEIMFERFMTPGRKSLPDIDVDFCPDDREKALEIVRRMYGRDNVSRIVSFNTLKMKAVIGDIGRSLEIDLKDAEKLKSKVKNDEEGNEITYEHLIDAASEFIDELRDKGDNYIQWLNYIEVLAGLKLLRNDGLHACGLIVSPQPAHELWPVTLKDEKRDDKKVSQIAVQYNMESIEEAGGIKMDFLGLKTLTLPVVALSYMGIDINDIPLDDPKVYEFITKDSLHGIFQAKDPGMKKLIRDIKPVVLRDLAVAAAAFRPAVLKLKLDQEYVKRKNGVNPVEYIHPDLEKVLKDTYGIFLYQDHTLATCKLIGMSDGEADNIRKAASKKKKDKMDELKIMFVDKATGHGWDTSTIESVWEVFEKGASYGFNFSHALTYGRWIYITSWIKCYYPEIFFAVSLTTRQDASNTSDEGILFKALIKDCVNHGVQLQRPDINSSIDEFMPIMQNRSVSYSLSAIDFISDEVTRWVMANRPFTSFDDFLDKLEKFKVFKNLNMPVDTVVKELNSKLKSEVNRQFVCPKRGKSFKQWVNKMVVRDFALHISMTNPIISKLLVYNKVRVTLPKDYNNYIMSLSTFGHGYFSYAVNINMFGSYSKAMKVNQIENMIYSGAFDKISKRRDAFRKLQVSDMTIRDKRRLWHEMTSFTPYVSEKHYQRPLASAFYSLYDLSEIDKVIECRNRCGYGFDFAKYNYGDSLCDLEDDSQCTIVGEVTSVKMDTVTRNKKKCHYIFIDNDEDQIMCMVWNDLEKIQEDIDVGLAVEVKGTKKSDKWSAGKSIVWVRSIKIIGGSKKGLKKTNVRKPRNTKSKV